MRTPPLSPAEASLNWPWPRPPAWIWLFTTQTGPPSFLAAASDSDACSTATPLEIGTPNSCSSALAWYSWMFIWTLPGPRAVKLQFPPALRLAYHIPTKLQLRNSSAEQDCPATISRSAAEQVGRDLLAGLDQALHRPDGLVERLAVLAGHFDLDNALDPLGADHHGHADIHVLHAVFAIEIGGAGQHALLVPEIALGH